MRFIIDEEICAEKGISLAELLGVLLVQTGVNVPMLFNSLEEKEVLVKDMFGNYLVTEHWHDVCSDVLLTAETTTPKEDSLDALVEKLRAIFPEGKKEGTTSTYFRGNLRDNKLKLKKFFKMYGNKFTEEQILDAARRYVASFNGNYTYMRALKYFIWKPEKKTNAEGKIYIEEVSDLATFIENKNEGSVNNDWATNLV